MPMLTLVGGVEDRPSRPGPMPGPSPRWQVNGWPLRVRVWTDREWAELADRPEDARPFPNGVWVAVGMAS